MTMMSSAPGRTMSLTDLKAKGRGLPTRMVMHGFEGIGKTSFAAAAPKPVFLLAKGETGLETLIDSKQLPDTPHFPEIHTWAEVLSVCDTLLTEEHDHKTFVLDTINGGAQLCFNEVCRRDYKDDWGPAGFKNYQNGFDTAMVDWQAFLTKLDALRERRKMAIILLAHTHVKTFKNPEGPDYDRYEVDLHHKLWGLTKRWTDIILFGNYETDLAIVSKGKEGKPAKGKATDGKTRTFYTVRTATYDAKHRHGLPEEIDMGISGKEAWTNFVTAMKEARK